MYRRTAKQAERLTKRAFDEELVLQKGKTPEPFDAVDIMFELSYLMAVIKVNKPNDRSAKDRAYQIALTDFEKLLAYWRVWAVGDGDLTGEWSLAEVEPTDEQKRLDNA